MSENNRIIIIDDDEGIRNTYVSIFSQSSSSGFLEEGKNLFGGSESTGSKNIRPDYDIVLAENGFDGIEQVRQAVSEATPFAVAFIDMKMPGLNGAQTSQQIWEIDPDIKIVIVTAYSEYSPEDIIEVTGRDDLFYLRKPFNQEEIMQFARALTYEWNLELKRNLLEENLKKTNKILEDMNQNLNDKVQKQAALIVQSEKMATIGLLAAGIAHEINNPIAFIGSNLSIIRDYLKSLKSLDEKFRAMESFLENLDHEEGQTVLKDIRSCRDEHQIEMILEDFEDITSESLEGIERVKTIVSDLKVFSRIDTPESGLLNINEAIDITLNILKNELKYTIDIQKKFGDIPAITCYPQKISQVFMNLIVNASQAIEGKGEIIISTEQVEKGRRSEDQFVRVTIEDTGCGIPQENIKKLFDPFFTTKPVGTGTGLGLSIVYEIIKVHNGEIDVESQPGKGSKFKVMIPVHFSSR